MRPSVPVVWPRMDFRWPSAGCGIGSASYTTVRFTCSTVAPTVRRALVNASLNIVARQWLPFRTAKALSTLEARCASTFSDGREIERSRHRSTGKRCILLHNRSDLANVKGGELVASVRHCSRQRRESSDREGNE